MRRCIEDERWRGRCGGNPEVVNHDGAMIPFGIVVVEQMIFETFLDGFPLGESGRAGNSPLERFFLVWLRKTLFIFLSSISPQLVY